MGRWGVYWAFWAFGQSGALTHVLTYVLLFVTYILTVDREPLRSEPYLDRLVIDLEIASTQDTSQ